MVVGNKFLQGNNSYCCGNNNEYYSFKKTNEKMLGIKNKEQIKFKIAELEIYKIKL